MAIVAAIELILWTFLQRFLISGPDLAIAAALCLIPWTFVQRFLISGGQFGNRCIHWAHSVDFRAVILDFGPRLANRCSQEVKTGQSLQPKGRSIVPRPGNAGWAGTSDGVAARGFVNGEGPAAQRWEGKHRRCAPVRSPCPQAEPATETAQTPQAEPATGEPSPPHYTKNPDSFLNRDP